MNTIIAVSKGNKTYYIHLACEDYYLSGGEPPGRWLGSGAKFLGLEETVSNEEFDRLFRGFSPDGRSALVRNAGSERRQSAWDMVASVPKSASVVWACGDERTRQVIEECQWEAVKRTLSYLEDNASFSRMGAGGKEKVRAGLVVASFEHGTSRTIDPQLHHHNCLLNVGVRANNSTGTLISRPFYLEVMRSGSLYRAELALQLEHRLGVKIERNGTLFEIEGVPHDLMDVFSSRRRAIVTALLEKGSLGNSQAAAVTCLETRPEKVVIARNQLFEWWQEVAHTFGFSSQEVKKLLHQYEPQMPIEQDRTCAYSQALDALSVETEERRLKRLAWFLEHGEHAIDAPEHEYE